MPDRTDRRLIARLQGTLPLSEQPFADLGRELGLAEDAVIDRLHHLLSQGVLGHFGPLFAAAPGTDQPAFAALQVPAADFERDLVTATASGLPLLARPYEAVGAMLGASGAQVREQFAAMLQQGRILRIGAVLAADTATGATGTTDTAITTDTPAAQTPVDEGG